ncbi:MAG: FAD-dependent oxidoreductase [Pseudomonadota bacterium]
MAKASVVIIGGGYVGAELAKGLEDSLDVTLVEPKEAFVHAPAMLRTLVEPALLDEALIPYDRLLKKGRLVKDRATAVDGDGVTLASGDKISADYIVVATGASNGSAFKPLDGDLDGFRTAQANLAQKISDAKTIAIVGAGAVGTELAGEIAHARPEKSVTLISSEPTLFPTMPAKLGTGLAKKLRGMGVDIRCGVRADNLESLSEPYAGTLTLSNGDTVAADLIVPAIGSKPQTALLADLPGAKVVKGGRVAVDDYLRPSTLENVFAAGDAVDPGDAMTIVAISRQQPWLAKTLKALAEGKSLSSQKAYTPWGKAPILIPLGPNQGNSFLMIATFGNWVTKMMKGRDLFIPKYKKIFGR